MKTLFCSAGFCLLLAVPAMAAGSLFGDGVESHAWGTPYAQFVGRKDMECIPKELFCRTKADENTVLGLPAGPVFFHFDAAKGLRRVELFFSEEEYAAFAKKLAPVVKNAAAGRKRSGTTVDGVAIAVKFNENAGLEVVTITGKP